MTIVEKDRAVADDPEAVDRDEPVGAVADRGRRAPEHGNLAGIRQRCPGRKVDEDFGGRLIETENRDVLGRGDAQVRDPERAQPAIIFGNADELENRRHASRRRLTSATIRLDSSRAVISILMAATLQRIAP